MTQTVTPSEAALEREALISLRADLAMEARELAEHIEDCRAVLASDKSSLAFHCAVATQLIRAIQDREEIIVLHTEITEQLG